MSGSLLQSTRPARLAMPAQRQTTAAAPMVDAPRHGPAGFIETSLSGRGRVDRRPIANHGCFGWLHLPADGPATGDVAVLICQGLVWDSLQPYHSLRLLADEFAAAGYPALRFDYPGTANSHDLPAPTEPDSEIWAVWQRSVAQAADRLKAETGATRIVYCGLRAGGALAMLVAARRADAAGVILLAPVLRGRSYMQQLRLQAQLEGGTNATEAGGLGFHELAFDAKTVATIAAVDLRTVRPQAGLAIGVFPQAPSSLVKACTEAWRGGGAVVSTCDYAGLEAVLRIEVQGNSPPPDFTSVLAWLTQALPQSPATPRIDPHLAGLTADLLLPHCIETPVRFGQQARLFGIICRPLDPSATPVDAASAVIIVNTGRDPLSGISRFGVELARRLAAAGIASLRMDFAGLGDSTGVPGHENHLGALFEDHRGADIAAALDLMQRHGYRRLILQGLCSGAHHAFHAAVADPRVAGLMLVNLPVFVWQTGDDVHFVAHIQRSPLSYLDKLLSRESWWRLLSGQIRLRRLARARLQRFIRRWAAAPQDVAASGVATLGRRGVRALFLFSPEDPGLDAMRQAFGARCERLQAAPCCTMEVMDGLDHVLSGHQMRIAVARRCLELIAAVPTEPFPSVKKAVTHAERMGA